MQIRPAKSEGQVHYNIRHTGLVKTSSVGEDHCPFLHDWQYHKVAYGSDGRDIDRLDHDHSAGKV